MSTLCSLKISLIPGKENTSWFEIGGNFHLFHFKSMRRLFHSSADSDANSSGIVCVDWENPWHLLTYNTRSIKELLHETILGFLLSYTVLGLDVKIVTLDMKLIYVFSVCMQ